MGGNLLQSFQQPFDFEMHSTVNKNGSSKFSTMTVIDFENLTGKKSLKISYNDEGLDVHYNQKNKEEMQTTTDEKRSEIISETDAPKTEQKQHKKKKRSSFVSSVYNIYKG